MQTGLDLTIVDNLTGGRIGKFDVACPLCGPQRRSPANQRKPVLRIWRIEPTFASFHCARCGERGYVRDSHAAPIDPVALERAKAEAAERERIAAGERLSTARWLWSKRRPIKHSLAERYLREARGYTGPVPATLGYLPPRDQHGPAMVAAFGIPTEPAPGILRMADDAVRGIHITRLALDGRGKAGTEADKIMVGMSAGWPIVLAPANDIGGLSIAEGIEDALSVHAATGLGAWAAGAASRLPALATIIPAYVEFVSVVADSDPDGARHAAELAKRVKQSGRPVRIVTLASAPQTGRAAA